MRSKLGTLFMHFGNLKTNHETTPKNHAFEVDNIGIPDQGLFFREGGFCKGVPWRKLKNTDQRLRKLACHRKKHGSSSAAVTPKSSPPKTWNRREYPQILDFRLGYKQPARSWHCCTSAWAHKDMLALPRTGGRWPSETGFWWSSLESWWWSSSLLAFTSLAPGEEGSQVLRRWAYRPDLGLYGMRWIGGDGTKIE